MLVFNIVLKRDNKLNFFIFIVILQVRSTILLQKKKGKIEKKVPGQTLDPTGRAGQLLINSIFPSAHF